MCSVQVLRHLYLNERGSPLLCLQTTSLALSQSQQQLALCPAATASPPAPALGPTNPPYLRGPSLPPNPEGRPGAPDKRTPRAASEYPPAAPASPFPPPALIGRFNSLNERLAYVKALLRLEGPVAAAPGPEASLVPQTPPASQTHTDKLETDPVLPQTTPFQTYDRPLRAQRDPLHTHPHLFTRSPPEGPPSAPPQPSPDYAHGLARGDAPIGPGAGALVQGHANAPALCVTKTVVTHQIFPVSHSHPTAASASAAAPANAMQCDRGREADAAADGGPQALPKSCPGLSAACAIRHTVPQATESYELGCMPQASAAPSGPTESPSGTIPGHDSRTGPGSRSDHNSDLSCNPTSDPKSHVTPGHASNTDRDPDSIGGFTVGTVVTPVEPSEAIRTPPSTSESSSNAASTDVLMPALRPGSTANPGATSDGSTRPNHALNATTTPDTGPAHMYAQEDDLSGSSARPTMTPALDAVPHPNPSLDVEVRAHSRLSSAEVDVSHHLDPVSHPDLDLDPNPDCEADLPHDRDTRDTPCSRPMASFDSPLPGPDPDPAPVFTARTPDSTFDAVPTSSHPPPVMDPPQEHLPVADPPPTRQAASGCALNPVDDAQTTAGHCAQSHPRRDLNADRCDPNAAPPLPPPAPTSTPWPDADPVPDPSTPAPIPTSAPHVTAPHEAVERVADPPAQGPDVHTTPMVHPAAGHEADPGLARQSCPASDFDPDDDARQDRRTDPQHRAAPSHGLSPIARCLLVLDPELQRDAHGPGREPSPKSAPRGGCAPPQSPSPSAAAAAGPKAQAFSGAPLPDNAFSAAAPAAAAAQAPQSSGGPNAFPGQPHPNSAAHATAPSRQNGSGSVQLFASPHAAARAPGAATHTPTSPGTRPSPHSRSAASSPGCNLPRLRVCDRGTWSPASVSDRLPQYPAHPVTPPSTRLSQWSPMLLFPPSAVHPPSTDGTTYQNGQPPPTNVSHRWASSRARRHSPRPSGPK